LTIERWLTGALLTESACRPDDRNGRGAACCQSHVAGARPDLTLTICLDSRSTAAMRTRYPIAAPGQNRTDVR